LNSKPKNFSALISTRVAPFFQGFESRSSVISKFFRRLHQTPDLTSLGAVIIASLSVTGMVLAARQLGWLQPVELAVFDRMVLRRADEGPDPRLLVVAITEDDIQTLKQSTISDQFVALGLEKLQQYQPAVIGLDIHRDIAQGTGIEQLEVQLKQTNVIAITKMGLSNTGRLEVPPPPSVPVERIGFNDIVQDADGVVRRSLLFGNLTPDTVLYSFALKVASSYLAQRKIEPQNSKSDPYLIQWGKATFTPLQPNSGGYEKLDAQGYQVLLNYRSPRNVARVVSLTQLLYGQIEPAWIKDKIVLIGYTAPSRRDLFLTPYSPSQKQEPKMAGVLVHAQMVSQILTATLGERPLFWFWPEWAEVLWVCFWAVVGGTLVWCVRHPVGLVVCVTGVVVIVFATGFYLFTRAGWVSTATPALATLVTSGLVLAYRGYQAQQQQQMVMKLLGQNTSPEVAEALWNSRDRLLKSGKLSGQKLIATMMFTDLKDFSTISEQMPPEVLLEWLNEYLSVLSETVQAHKGIINKFTGDGIMAAFGVPMIRNSNTEIAEDARHAVSCGVAFGERLKEINADWQRRGLPVVQMRVGIFTGPVVAGSLGGKERMEYGIIGDSVNIASRLESCEKDRQSSICRVLIAKETLVHIEDEFLVEHWGPLALKGKQQTVDVYRVVCRRTQSPSQ
jgi:CHASE2 domain-containing sensor protein/class 3 adenylate cyclase